MYRRGIQFRTPSLILGRVRFNVAVCKDAIVLSQGRWADQVRAKLTACLIYHFMNYPYTTIVSRPGLKASEVKLTFADFVSAENSQILALSAWWILLVYRRGFSYIFLVRSQLIKQIQSVKFSLQYQGDCF